MGNGVRVRRAVCAAVLFFCAVKVAVSSAPAWAAESQAVHAVRDLNVSDIFVPPDLGYVTDTSQSRPSNPSVKSPVIIHIQEAHTNYEGQKHLVDILTRLIEQYHLKLIMVEGGQGDVSLSYMRSYGPVETRKQVAEKYLKIGIISGEEYLDIVSDYPLILWGVEQDDLYQQNLDAFMKADDLKASAMPIVASVRSTVESLRPLLSDPDLNDLQAKTKAFQQDTLGLADYADALASLAAQHGLAEHESHNVKQFREVRQLEKALDLTQVSQEQQALTKALSLRASAEALNNLISQAKAMKEGNVTREAFYTGLEELAVASNLPLGQYPTLYRYITYVKQRAQLQPTALSDELKALAATLQDRMASTPESRQLQTIEHQVGLVENLVDLRLSPAEYEELQSLGLIGLCMQWKSFLDGQAARHGFTSPSENSLSELNVALPKLARFYKAASKREEALVTNALAKLKETEEPVAVLITGGFHSSKITQLLTDGGVSTVVIAPKITQATNERLYRAVLKYKSGHGVFEDVMAVAGTPDAATGSQPTTAVASSTRKQ